MVVKNYYRILGVSLEAKAEDIKKAYRRLAKNFHPDARPSQEDAEAQEKFREITEAYEVLIDPERRVKYDRMNRIRWETAGIHTPPDSPSVDDEMPGVDANGDNPPEPEQKSAGESYTDPSPFARERSGFGHEGMGVGEATPEAAVERVVEVAVSFETAVRGGVQRTTLAIEGECSSCRGTGSRTKKGITICPGCGGSGYIPGSGLSVSETEKCPRCEGRGTLIRERCRRCRGTGRKRKERNVSVRVPPGAEDGMKRMLGEILQTPEDISTDGIQVVFRVQAHPFFHRSGLDILCEFPIGFDVAIRGGGVQVRTAHGHRVVLKIPPGTDSGTTFRIGNEGVLKGGQQGDQLVTVKIVTPKRLSEKAKKYLDLFLREVDG
jgi:molecular chaperone DnaJ